MSGIDGSIRISDDDLLKAATAMTGTEWDRFWGALGIVVRRVALTRAGLREATLSNFERPRPEEPRPQPQKPDPVAPLTSETPRETRPPSNAERMAASRKRGAERAGFVKGGKPGAGPPNQTGKKRSPEAREKMRVAMEASWARRRASNGDTATSPATPAAPEPQPAIARPDFADRARKAAERTWREAHPDEASA